jgi:putative tryptophan/tyrosine transport system substrate-binding protein
MATNIPRRQFIAALGGAAAVWSVAARAQQPAMPVPVLGYVAAKNVNPKRLEVFRQGLTDLGYAEGRNIRIDYREAVLDAEYANHVTELINSKVDIILAANAPAAVAAAHATKTVPIVMLAVNDPVGLSLVKSLEHPGTNVTGTTMYAPQPIGERLRILKSLVPNLDKVDGSERKQKQHFATRAGALGRPCS